LRSDPKLDMKLISLRTFDRLDATLIDPARVDEVFDHATEVILDLGSFTRPSRIDDDIAGCSWIVL